jgi:hypothetical protein
MSAAHQFGISARQRELDALVPADRPVEDHPLLRVIDALVEEPAAVADAFLRHQNALGDHALEDVAEALRLFRRSILRRHFVIVEEDLGRAVVDHRLDRADLDPVPQILARIDEEIPRGHRHGA